MSKLSKQDKIDIYNLWKNYQVGSGELSRRYDVNISVLNYLVALIDRHGFSILNKSYITYSAEFKEQAIRHVIVNHESLYSVALDLGLKSPGILFNWVRSYKENGYNVIIKPKYS